MALYEATVREHEAQRAVGQVLVPPKAGQAGPVSSGAEAGETSAGTLAGA